jgi:hypothetical protein
MNLLKQLEHRQSGGVLPEARGRIIFVDWRCDDFIPESIEIKDAPKNQTARTRPRRPKGPMENP